MALSIPYEWGKLCEAIGIDPSLVRHISIELPADGPVIFRVELYGTEELLSYVWTKP